MRERLQQRTVDGFPGVQTGPGWDNLLTLVDAGIARLAPGYGLFYVTADDGRLTYRTDVDELHGVGFIVDVARSVAATTCELCGRDGRLSAGAVRCDACRVDA